VRVRILKPLVGVVDRVSLGHLKPGFMYDLKDSLARYLISFAGAEESTFSKAALVMPIDDPYIAHLTGGITVSQSDPATVNDKSAKKRTRKRR
jgi:hypothetical protein